jgi:hypothetical protein
MTGSGVQGHNTAMTETRAVATQAIESWGMRLSDKLRLELARGDATAALRLARHGDGQTRNLAGEYAFMARGLGVVVDLLLRLLLEAASRAQPPNGGTNHPVSAASVSLGLLLTGLLEGLRDAVRDDALSPATGMLSDSPTDLLTDACTREMKAALARFTLQQTRLAEEVMQAVAQGQSESATELLAAKDHAYRALHDVMLRFMADSFVWIYRTFGKQALLDFHLATAERQRAGFEKWEHMPTAEFAATTAFLMKQHMGQVEVLEDDRRFTIVQSPCGSGGGLRLAGAYDGPHALPFVEGPDPLTFGERRMPVYCTHCAIWNGAATIRWFGHAQWVFDQPCRLDGGCTLHIYKRREDIPADYARSVGLDSAESGS